MPNAALSEQLHAQLDAMGAPPRDPATIPAETLDDSQTESGESQGLGEAMAQPDNDAGESREGVTDSTAEISAAETGKGGETGDKALKYKPTELADAIGWEVTELYDSLMVPIGNQGETRSLGDIKQNYDAVAESEAEINTARADLQARYEQLYAQQQQLTQGFAGVSEEVNKAQRSLVGIEAQYNSQPWEKLDAENPGQAANLRQKFSAAYGAAEAELKTATQNHEQVQAQSHQQMVAAENQRLVQMVPEWQSAKVFREEEPQISEYLISMGFTPQQLQSIVAAAPRAVARDAWLYRQHLKQVSTAKGKVRAAPKPVMRPGGGPGRKTISDKQTDQLTARARQTGRASDKLAAARAIVGASLQR